jgi:type VI secretion system secreted protein Hcp
MAEMFLQLDGIEGESLDQTHGGQIEIKGWGWKTSNSVKWDVNQGGQSTKVVVEHIAFQKTCDKASPALHKCCVTGKHIKQAKITCRKNDGDHKFEYLLVTLKDILISEFSWAGDGENQALTESVNLSFAEYKIEYYVQDDSGNSKGGISFGFNVQKQAEM